MTQVFRPLASYPGYRISDRGRLQSCWVVRQVRGGRRGEAFSEMTDAWHDMKTTRIKGRYMQAAMKFDGGKVGRYVHDLVLETFVGPRPDGMQCRHLNGIGTDNRLENLAWGTSAENGADMVRHGTQPFGERNSGAKIRERDAIRIHRLYNEGRCRTDLAREYGLSMMSVWRIGTGRQWKYLSDLD